MLISGIQKFTLLDYPNKIACVVFTAGCNFRCPFCHNAEFVLPEKIVEIKDNFITHEAILNFLKTRVGKIDGVVISGGEPTLQSDLEDFIDEIKKLNFLIKLDTNGTNPEILKKLVKSKKIDFVAMDLKIDWKNYQNLVKGSFNLEKVKESLNFLKQNEINFEIRSTIIKEIHTFEVLEEMGEILKGVNKIYLQNFNNKKTLDSDFFYKNSFSNQELQKAKNILEKYVEEVILRN